MFKGISIFLVAGLSASAFAAVTYTPAGTQVTLDQAVQTMVSQNNCQFVAFQGALFVECGEEGKGTWAPAASLDDLKASVAKQETKKTVTIGQTTYTFGYERLESSAIGKVYDMMDAVANTIDASKDIPAPQTQDDIEDALQFLYNDTFEITSIFGENVTYHEQSGGYGGGAAHDWESNDFASKDDLGETGSILPYVDNTSLLNALKNDSYIQKVAKETKMTAKLKSITQLTDFAQFASEMFMNSDEPYAWSFKPMDQFSQFAVYDYDPKTNLVTLRLGLQYQYEVNRGQMTQLGLKVKATPEGAALFAKAKAGQGVLWVNAKKI